VIYDIGEIGRAVLVKKVSSSQSKAKKGLKAGAVATAVAKKVAVSVRKSIQEKSGRVAAPSS
jgi:hypothetical protein